MRQSSSSGSEDEPSQSYSNVPYDLVEQHSSKKCKYERSSTQDGIVHIHIRICKCSNFSDMSHLIGRRMDFTECDGKEIHTDHTCRWIRKKVKINGQRAYRLSRYCCCKTTSQASTGTRSMNCKQCLIF